MKDKYRFVGERIRKERMKYDLNLNELAEGTGLSTSFLSLLENGKTSPSLKALDKIATFLNIHIATLFVDQEEKDWVHLSQKDQVEIVNEGERTLRFVWARAKGCDGVLLTLKPQAQARGYTSHKGIEFGYVLKGQITVILENKDEPIICETGDSIIYNAAIPHRIINTTDEEVQGFWVNLQTNNGIIDEL